MTINLSVIGCGKIGTSIGLALKNHKQEIHRTCFDRIPAISKQAQDMQAFDKIALRINECVENADVVILAIPVDELQITIDTIVPFLKPGSTLIDTSLIKISIKECIEEKLPEDRYFLSFFPTINPAYIHEGENSPEFAHEDLFRNSLIVITGSSRTSNEALKLGTDLSTNMGAQVLFADPHEVDGLLAATEILPKLISSAYIHAVMDQPGWKEGRKLTNNSFNALTQLITHLDEREDYGKSSELNKENTIRTINNMIISLKNIRDFLQQGNSSAIQKWYQDSLDNHNKWSEERKLAAWNKIAGKEDIPSSADFFKNLLGFGRKRKDK
ncbi:MAG: prephenate dehydrogenase [Anaerolineaceae bacterium]|nr:prephenate dehydrogenase [Anaerolineaceae bacterium]